MGEGITGTAALRGQTLNIGDAQDCEFAEDVEGTDDIEESIVAVPMRFERSTIGVIVLSKLGKNQFSTLSVRLLELLAAQAAVAFENARLLEAERQSAAVSKALLEIATAASREASPQGWRAERVGGVRMAGRDGVALVVEHGGRGRVIASCGDEAVRSVGLAVSRGHPAEGVGVVATGDVPSFPSRRQRPPGRGGRRRCTAGRWSWSATDADRRPARRSQRRRTGDPGPPQRRTPRRHHPRPSNTSPSPPPTPSSLPLSISHPPPLLRAAASPAGGLALVASGSKCSESELMQ